MIYNLRKDTGNRVTDWRQHWQLAAPGRQGPEIWWEWQRLVGPGKSQKRSPAWRSPVSPVARETTADMSCPRWINKPGRADNATCWRRALQPCLDFSGHRQIVQPPGNTQSLLESWVIMSPRTKPSLASISPNKNVPRGLCIRDMYLMLVTSLFIRAKKSRKGPSIGGKG